MEAAEAPAETAKPRHGKTHHESFAPNRGDSGVPDRRVSIDAELQRPIRSAIRTPRLRSQRIPGRLEPEDSPPDLLLLRLLAE